MKDMKQEYLIWTGEVVACFKPETWVPSNLRTWGDVVGAGWKFAFMLDENTIVMTNDGYINGFQYRKKNEVV
jgi:hypothetical protein